MIDQFINFVIRPPRAEYNPNQHLWDTEFTLAGRRYQRKDVELQNERGHTLQCSHYVPSPFPENTPLPCVIYCHGNSGCRADANEAALLLLPSNITVFTLDFSGSGLSEGDYVSLGWYEKDDLKAVVSFLRSSKQISCIGIWGRSMGAVTSLLYGAEDASIAGMVLDSAFSNLFDLMMELAIFYKIRLPKFTVKMGLQYMRRVIQRKAKFDIMDLNCIQVAPKTFIPALFGHASDDIFIQPHHSDLIFNSYVGDKNIIKFEGNHNSPRPQSFYDSVCLFFYNVLCPSQYHPTYLRKHDKYCDFRDSKSDACLDEHLIKGASASTQSKHIDASSSSSAPCDDNDGNSKYMGNLFSENGSCRPTISDLEQQLAQWHELTVINGNSAANELCHLEVTAERQNEDCESFSSSNRESWGRCSSLGADVSDEESFSEDCTKGTKIKKQITLRVLATPLRRIQRKIEQPKEKKKFPYGSIKVKSQYDRMESLSHRLCFCILKGSKHKRTHSS